MSSLEKWMSGVKERLEGHAKIPNAHRTTFAPTDLKKALMIIESIVKWADDLPPVELTIFNKDGHEVGLVLTKDADKIAAMTDEEIWTQ